MSLPAAGWYPQPDGSHRYWDGQGWTSHVVSAAEVAARRPPQLATQPAAPATAQYAAQQGAVPPVTRRKPLHQRVWFWAIILVVTLPLIGSMLLKGGSASTAPAALTSVSPKATGTATKKPAKKPSSKKSTAPAPARDVYATLSSRQFKLLAKDPDSYAGKTYILYGEITQFDAATGRDTFLANSGPAKKPISYGYADYAQNSEFTSDEIMLDDLVEGDCFKAKVTVLGSDSYDTQVGGRTTVPKFGVDSISRYGHTKG